MKADEVLPGRAHRWMHDARFSGLKCQECGETAMYHVGHKGWCRTHYPQAVKAKEASLAKYQRPKSEMVPAHWSPPWDKLHHAK